MDLFKYILEEYKEDIFNDTEAFIKLKQTINKLNVDEKNLLLLYADMGSLRKTANIIGCSASTIYLKITEIRKKLIELLDNDNN